MGGNSAEAVRMIVPATSSAVFKHLRMNFSCAFGDDLMYGFPDGLAAAGNLLSLKLEFEGCYENHDDAKFDNALERLLSRSAQH